MAVLEKERKSKNKFSYDNYCSWPDDERWELIGGQAYNMAPAPNRRHQKILQKLSLEIGKFLEDKPCELYIAPFDVRLAEKGETEKTTTNVVQPDLVVFCDEKNLDEKGAIGPPDLVIEILSPSTAKKDQTIKYKLYERFGVKEYWVIQPEDNIVYIWNLKKTKESQEFEKSFILTEKDTATSNVLGGLLVDLEKVLV